MNSERNRHTVIISLVAFTIISASLIANYQNTNAAVYPLGNGKGDYRFGRISSVQHDQNDIPAWVLSGVWKSDLAANQSAIGNQGNETFPGRSFNAQFEMVLLNGTAAHTHTVTNFISSNSSQQNNSTFIFNGTATASMREGPITEIPTSISIVGNKVISIWLDPSTVNNHYGNTPIYGIVIDESDNRRIPVS